MVAAQRNALVDNGTTNVTTVKNASLTAEIVRSDPVISTIPSAGLELFAMDSLGAGVLVEEYKGQMQEIPDSDGETLRATKRKRSQSRGK